MVFTPPNPEETLKAIGNIKDLPITLQKSLYPKSADIDPRCIDIAQEKAAL